MDDSKWERWGALGGILFAVLVAITFFLPGSPPKTSDSATKIAKFIADKDDALRWSGYIGAVAVIPLYWWLGSVWRLMRRSEGGSPRLAVAALSGAVFASVLATIGGVTLAVLPIVGVRTLGTGGARTFYLLSTNLAISTEFGLAVFLGAFSALIIRSRVLPPVLGWLGALIALVAVVGGAAVATTRDAIFVVAFVAFLAFLVWVLVVSILMLRGPQESAASAA
ncbi:MAG: hypothetical protein WD271_10620 [Acidimicrobiia bacterium]